MDFLWRQAAHLIGKYQPVGGGVQAIIRHNIGFLVGRALIQGCDLDLVREIAPQAFFEMRDDRLYAKPCTEYVIND